jgi:hypothetical protein
MTLRELLRWITLWVSGAPWSAAGAADTGAFDLQRAAAAVRDGRAALGGLLPSQLRRLDVELRSHSSWGDSWIAELQRVHPASVRSLAEASGDTETTAVLLATHPSGWVRETAIALLAESSSPLSVGMLVVRASDWVSEVRAAARTALRRVVEREGPEALLPCLPLLEQTGDGDARGRAFALEMLDVARHASPEALRRALHSPDRRTRRASARVLAHRALALSALDDALAQDDPVTLSLVAEGTLADAPLSVVERLSRPPAIARVRALALRRLFEHETDGGAAHAEGALLDRSASVRAMAQTWLQRAGVDVAALYAARLDAPSLAAGATGVAVRGLAETGSSADLDRLAPFAVHASARVREAVCAAIERLGAADRRDELFAFARDPSRRIARRAGLALVRSRLDRSQLDRLWACATERADASLLPAFTSLDRWQQVLYAARGLPAGSPLAAALLEHAMATWNRSFTSPPAAVGDELRQALPRVLTVLGAEKATLLRHSLRPFLPGV